MSFTALPCRHLEQRPPTLYRLAPRSLTEDGLMPVDSTAGVTDADTAAKAAESSTVDAGLVAGVVIGLIVCLLGLALLVRHYSTRCEWLARCSPACILTAAPP